MKLPGPDHPISIEPNPNHIRVRVGDTIVADTTRALTLREASYPEVQYIPRSDATMALLTPTDRVTHCPYKGDASYYSVAAGAGRLENVVWSYETPYPAMQQIAGYLAFYANKVTVETVR